MLFRLIHLVASICVLLSSSSVAKTNDDVTYMTPRIHGVLVNVVEVNLQSRRYYIRPVTADETRERKSRLDTFKAMIASTHARAAINGTYFDCSTLRTLGTIVQNGRMVQDGYIGNAIGVDQDLQPHFLKVNHENGNHVDWGGYRFAICSGPTLVYRHHIALNPWAEGFKDPHIYATAARSAIGLTDSHRLILVTIHRSITLSKLAAIMQQLGADYALNLDGGSSSALYYGGHFITRPNRSLTNILTVCPVHASGTMMDYPSVISYRHKSRAVRPRVSKI
ncbi:MAG TPA: phosphodiester glycosidase family protein [Candidatus Xenobia bacterium]